MLLDSIILTIITIMEMAQGKPSLLFRLITFIIQYAKDEDVGQLLEYCSIEECLLCKEQEQLYRNKESLLYWLFVSNYQIVDIGEGDEIPKYQNVKLLLRHLLGISGCIFSYDYEFVKDNFAEVFHIVIEYYKKYKFYYDFYGKIFRVVKLATNNFYDVDKFNISYLARKTVLEHEETGKTYTLNTHLRNYIKDNDANFYVEISTLAYFKKINDKLYKLFDSDNKYCTWCNPSNKAKSKRKCTNCKNLSDELKNLQEISNNENFKYKNINSIISKITDTNIKKLKKKRKAKILELINSITIEDKEYYKRLKKLINKSFNN
jgi:hypothetical protein